MRRASNSCTCGDLSQLSADRSRSFDQPAAWVLAIPPQMTRVLLFDLAIDEQVHVFAVATSPDEFPARPDVRRGMS